MKMKDLARNKVLRKAAYNPLNKLIEECGELITALMKLRANTNVKTIVDTKEELADVLFHIEGFLFANDIQKKELVQIAYRKTVERFPEELK